MLVGGHQMLLTRDELFWTRKYTVRRAVIRQVRNLAALQLLVA